MPFYELHLLNHTVLHYTKGDLFIMLYGSFLDIQTLSPKVSLVVIRKKKRWQTIQQKIKCPDLVNVFLFFLYFISDLCRFPRSGNGCDFLKNFCLEEFTYQTNMHLTART